MLGLFGALNLGERSLQTQRQGVEITGHNLANVNNTAYTRQRLTVETGLTIPTLIGPQGTGAEAVAITQIRNELVDRQLCGEISVTGFWDAQQRALLYAQADLGQEVDRNSTSSSSTVSTSGDSQQGIAEGMAGMFAALQSLATNPTSLAERQVLLMKAQDLTTKINQVDSRLENLRISLNDSVNTDVEDANRLLSEVAKLNDQIIDAEINTSGVANDLRDMRQQKLEELAKLVNFSAATAANGSVDITIDGVAMVTNNAVLENLQTYDPGTGRLLVRSSASATPLNLTAGAISGTIEARDGAVAQLQTDLNGMTTLLITEVNTIHSAGFSLNGNTGRPFFTGTGAADIAVNAALLSDPAEIQASAAAGTAGDNQVVLQLAKLATKPHPSLSNQTFEESYGRTVAAFGQSLSSVNNSQDNQAVVESMLRKQRDSTSGVSLDEEMTELLKYQKAYQASARLITTIDEMLDMIIGMKR